MHFNDAWQRRASARLFNSGVYLTVGMSVCAVMHSMQVLTQWSWHEEHTHTQMRRWMQNAAKIWYTNASNDANWATAIVHARAMSSRQRCRCLSATPATTNGETKERKKRKKKTFATLCVHECEKTRHAQANARCSDDEYITSSSRFQPFPAVARPFNSLLHFFFFRFVPFRPNETESGTRGERACLFQERIAWLTEWLNADISDEEASRHTRAPILPQTKRVKQKSNERPKPTTTTKSFIIIFESEFWIFIYILWSIAFVAKAAAATVMVAAAVEQQSNKTINCDTILCGATQFKNSSASHAHKVCMYEAYADLYFVCTYDTAQWHIAVGNEEQWNWKQNTELIFDKWRRTRRKEFDMNWALCMQGIPLPRRIAASWCTMSSHQSNANVLTRQHNQPHSHTYYASISIQSSCKYTTTDRQQSADRWRKAAAAAAAATGNVTIGYDSEMACVAHSELLSHFSHCVSVMLLLVPALSAAAFVPMHWHV